MSMNLHVSFAGKKFDLWQTPTFITYMCMTSLKGRKFETTGKDAIRALECYKIFVSSLSNGCWDSKEALDARLASISEHNRELDEMINSTSPRRICVYIL